MKKKMILLLIGVHFCLNIFSQTLVVPDSYNTRQIGQTIVIEPTIGTLIRMIHQNINEWKENVKLLSYSYATDFSDNVFTAFENGSDAYKNKAHHIYKKELSGVYIEFLSIMPDQINNYNFYDNIISLIPFNGYKYGGNLNITYHKKEGAFDMYTVVYEHRIYGLFLARDNKYIRICLKWFKDAQESSF